MGYHGVTIQINSEEELSFSVKEGPTWNFRDFYTPQNVGEKLSRFLSFTLRVFRRTRFEEISLEELRWDWMQSETSMQVGWKPWRF